MYYEIYVDTLFLVNFVMNLYLLMLANIGVRRTATRLRMIGAAAAGATVYVLGITITFLPAFLCLILQTAAASMLMIKIAFKPSSLRGYKKLLENLLGYSFLVGGILYALMRYLEGFADRSFGIAFVMGTGGMIYLFCSYLAERKKANQEICLVTLHNGQNQVKVKALLDTGNGLIEPISAKPVSVTDSEVLKKLWPEGLPELFRVVPYHTVGRAGGLMKGYLVDYMTVEQEGVPGCYEKVYIAAGEQPVSVRREYEMILNPMVLNRERSWEKGEKHDIKSSDAGEIVFQIDSEGKESAFSKAGRYPLHRRQ